MGRVVAIFFILAICSFGGQAQDTSYNGNGSSLHTGTQKVKVFPNPATNVVNILGLKNSNRADIMISDVYGNTRLQYQWQIKNNAINIPVANLDTGIYIVTIISQEQKVQTKFYKK